MAILNHVVVDRSFGLSLAEELSLVELLAPALNGDNPAPYLDALWDSAGGNDSDGTLGCAIQLLSAHDFNACLLWIDGKNLSWGGRYRLRGLVLDGFASADPKAAARVSEGLPSGEEKGSMMYAVLQRWGETDPRAAAAWLQTLKSTQIPDLAREAFLEQWMARDPTHIQDALALAGSLEEKAHCIDTWGKSMALRDLGAALNSANAIAAGDPELGQHAWNAVFAELAKLDPASAMSLAARLPEASAEYTPKCERRRENRAILAE